jgi:hypothetical protein
VTEILSDTPGVGAMTLALRAARQGLAGFAHPSGTKSFGTHGGEDEPLHHAERSKEPPTDACHAERSEASVLACPEESEIVRFAPNDGHRGFANALAPPCDPWNRALVDSDRALIVIDTTGDFYPPAAAPFGIDPEQVVVIRTSDRRDAFWAMDQSLRCAGVAVVVAAVPGLDETQSRRLQLAAEASGSIGLLLAAPRPHAKSFAAVRIALQPALSLPETLTLPSPLGRGRERDVSTFRRFDVSTFLTCVSVLSVREGMPSGPVFVDLHHATGACDLHPLPDHRSAARSAS